MNVALRKPMSGEEFLAWEERQELRYEYDGFAPVAMTGGTQNHGLVQSNLVGALYARLRGKPCRVFGSEVKLSVSGSFRYPDAVIVCTVGRGSATLLDDPVAVFEIVSASTAKTDRFIKNAEYRDTPSIQRYVILEQDAIAAEVFTRIGQDWAGRVQAAGSILAIPEAGIELPLDELYEGVELAA